MKSDLTTTATTALAISPPVHFTPYAEPDFGTPTFRINKLSISLNPNDCIEYSQLSAWNADDSLVMFTKQGLTTGFQIVDPKIPGSYLHEHDYNTGSDGIGALSFNHYGAAPRWDPVNRLRIWFLSGVNTTTCTTTNGSFVLTNVATPQGLNIGDTVRVPGAGPNVTQGTVTYPGDLIGKVQSVVANQITLDVAATLTASGMLLKRSTRLCRYDLVPSGNLFNRTITAVKDFTEYYKFEEANGWEDMSDDGRWIAFHARVTGSKRGDPGDSGGNPTGTFNNDSAPRNHEIFAYDVVNNVKSPILQVEQSPLAIPPSQGGTAPIGWEPYGRLDCVDSLDWVAASPSGTYLTVQNNKRSYLAYPGDANSGWSKGTGLNCYQMNTGTYAGKLSATTGHGDPIIDSSGQEWFVQTWDSNVPFDGPWIVKLKYPEAVAWSGTPYTSGGASLANTYTSGKAQRLFNHGYSNIHISTRNTAEGDFCIISATDVFNGDGTVFTTGNVHNEIVKVFLDSKVDMGSFGIGDALHFERLCHHRSSNGNFASFSYYRNPFGNPSRHGDRIAYNSDFGSTSNASDMYIMDIDWFRAGRFTAKTWRQSPQITQYANRMGSHNGWWSIAQVNGADRTKDSIIAHGANTAANGWWGTDQFAGFNNYGNDTWRYDPNLWKWILDSVSDQSGYKDTDQTAQAKNIRRVETGVTSATVNIVTDSGSSNKYVNPGWTTGPGGTHIDIWDFLGVTKKYSALELSAVGASSVTFTSSVTVVDTDILYDTTLTPPPFPNWFSFKTKPWMGHPYGGVREDRVRNKVWVGSKNSSKPFLYTSHSMLYDPIAKTWTMPHQGTWLSVWNNVSLLAVTPGTRFDTPIPNAWANCAGVHITTNDELFRYGGSEPNYGSLGSSPHTWIMNCTTNIWTDYNAVPNPGTKQSPACWYDSKRNRVYLWGGFDGSGLPTSTMWYWDCVLHTWNTVSYSGPGPNPRGEVSSAYDATNDCALVAGGRFGSNSTDLFQTDSYLFHSDTNTWEGLGQVPFIWDQTKAANDGVAQSPMGGDNRLVYMAAPYSCFALLNVRLGKGPDIHEFNAFYDPHFIYLRVTDNVASPPPPPPTILGQVRIGIMRA